MPPAIPTPPPVSRLRTTADNGFNCYLSAATGYMTSLYSPDLLKSMIRSMDCPRRYQGRQQDIWRHLLITFQQYLAEMQHPTEEADTVLEDSENNFLERFRDALVELGDEYIDSFFKKDPDYGATQAALDDYKPLMADPSHFMDVLTYLLGFGRPGMPATVINGDDPRWGIELIWHRENKTQGLSQGDQAKKPTWGDQ